MRIALIGLAALLSACATPSTGDLVIEAGPKPTHEQATEAVMQYFRENLKDPDSVKQFRLLQGPKLFSWYRGLAHGGGHEDAWLVCFEFNAKNSYGGYVGLTTKGIAMRAWGETIQVIPNVNWVIADRRC